MRFKRILNKSLTPLLLFAFLLAGEQGLHSQNLTSGIKGQFLTNSKQALEDTLNKRTTQEFPFIIGRLHQPVTNNFIHPYYNENKWVSGSLVYDGRVFKAGNLKYDIEKDKLIFLMQTKDFVTNTIALDENFIPEFVLVDKTFRYYTDYYAEGMKAGYYEVVFDGKVKFLVRWKKSESLGYNPYNISEEMYLLKDGRMFHINSMGKLINQLKDKKKEVKRFARENYLKLSLYDFSSAPKVLSYYLSLREK